MGSEMCIRDRLKMIYERRREDLILHNTKIYLVVHVKSSKGYLCFVDIDLRRDLLANPLTSMFKASRRAMSEVKTLENLIDDEYVHRYVETEILGVALRRSSLFKTIIHGQKVLMYV